MSPDDLRDGLRADVRLGAVLLLGSRLIHGDLVAQIVETEAYRGVDDPGSHAFRGPTPRCQTMFGEPGLAYVYFTYGMHWMLNVASLPPSEGAAVLVRAAIPLEGLETMRSRRARARHDRCLLSGPARLCAAFDISGADNGIDLLDPRSELKIEPGCVPKRIQHGPRIGLAAGKGERTPWRFVDADSLEWVSSNRTGLVPLEVEPDRLEPFP